MDARREPTFHDGGKGHGGGLRVNPSDRPGYVNPRGEEPHLDERDDEPVDAKPRSRGSRKKEQSKDRPFGRTRRYRRSLLGGLIYWALVLAVWSIIGVSAVIAYHAAKLPPIDQLAVPKRPPNVAILASDGTLLVNRGETGGQEVPITELPTYLPKAFIAIEDRRFESHWGIDPRGLARALVNNLGDGGTQGGSTITQQLAKITFLTPERSLVRKAREMLIAFWLEAWLTKDEILERYLSNVYFGDNVYGLRAASLHYFYRQPERLTLSQSVMLAGLVQAPSRLAPTKNPERAAKRAQLVLNAMVANNVITRAKADATPVARLDVRVRETLPTGTYFADWAIPQARLLTESGYADVRITTTLDARLQNIARKVVARSAVGNAQINMGHFGQRPAEMA